MTDIVNDRFKLLKKCGSGGTGDVYEALDLRLKRKVAIKRARKDYRGDREERASRLLKEAEHLALASHPNVVLIHDVIEAQDSVSLVLELVDGIPFQELYRKQAVAESECLEYLRQILSALEHVHAAGIVHRDINPRNVLVCPDGTVKLTDFGLSSLAADPQPRAGGSIGYMAPEALRRGKPVGFGVDIYGAGMLTYQALLGRPEFQKLYGAVESVEWARWLLSREKFRTLLDLGARVSPGISTVVEKMLEKDPRARYPRAEEVTRDLENLTRKAGEHPSVRGPSLLDAMRRILPALLARPQSTE